MNQHRLTTVTHSLSNRPSRRDVLRGLAAAGLGLGALRLSAPVEAANKKKRRKRKKRTNQQIPQNQQTLQTTCQPGTQVGAVSVPATGATVSTPVLQQGRRYRLRANGFWIVGNNSTDAFAHFSSADPNTPIPTFQGVRLGLSVDEGSADFWGSYNANHVYEREVTGQGRALSLRCVDTDYTGNTGSLLVDVFCA